MPLLRTTLLGCLILVLSRLVQRSNTSNSSWGCERHSFSQVRRYVPIRTMWMGSSEAEARDLLYIIEAFIHVTP